MTCRSGRRACIYTGSDVSQMPREYRGCKEIQAVQNKSSAYGIYGRGRNGIFEFAGTASDNGMDENRRVLVDVCS